LNISQEGEGFLQRLKRGYVKEAECAFSSFRNETSLFIILWGKGWNKELLKQWVTSWLHRALIIFYTLISNWCTQR